MPDFLGDHKRKSQEPESYINDAPPEQSKVDTQKNLSRSSTTQKGGNDAWDSFSLLALDGGGVRGYWSLLMLEALMQCVGQVEEAYTRTQDRIRIPEPARHSFHPQSYPSSLARIGLSSKEERRAAQNLDENESYLALEIAKRFLPCHYFDFIGGSSTGALIAIMLGRLRMTVPDALREYETLGSEIFGRPRWLCELNFPVISRRTKYDANRLLNVFEGVVERRREKQGNEDQPPSNNFPSRKWLCKTFVTTFATATGSVTAPHILRSYDYTERKPSTRVPAPPSRKPTYEYEEDDEPEVPKNSPQRQINKGHADRYDIPVVARAATAALCYFDPLKVMLANGRCITFEDGGFGTTNNPTQVGIEEIQGLHSRERLGAIVSVGTARNDNAEEEEKRVIRHIARRIKRLANMATSPETVHRTLLHDIELEGRYFRLNPDSEEHLLDLPLDQWEPRNSKRKRRHLLRRDQKEALAGSETIAYMRTQFDKYIKNDEVKAQLRRCARQLVRRRRDRIPDTSRWERYSIGASFKCEQAQEGSECQEDFWLRVDFEKHLTEVHGLRQGTDEFRTVARRSMTLFRYQSADDHGG